MLWDHRICLLDRYRERLNMQKPTVGWTDRHIEDLEKVFPELVGNQNVNELLVSAGRREVIQYIRNMVLNNRKVLHD